MILLKGLAGKAPIVALLANNKTDVEVIWCDEGQPVFECTIIENTSHIDDVLKAIEFNLAAKMRRDEHIRYLVLYTNRNESVFQNREREIAELEKVYNTTMVIACKPNGYKVLSNDYYDFYD